MTTIPLLNVYFMAAIPLGFLILFFMKLINGRKVNPRVRNFMWLFWGINVISMVLFSVSMVKEFNHKGEVSEIIIQDLDTDNLHIKSISTNYDEILMSLGDLKIGDESLISNEIRLKISQADNDQFTILKDKSARGNSSKTAHQSARGIQNLARVNQDVFEFEDVIKIDEGQKWRNQHVDIDIKVPIGKTIEFDNSQKRFSIRTDDGYISGRRLKGKRFKMTEDGLVCENCSETVEK